MGKEFSIYLDLVRFIAAMLVVVYHSNIRLLITEKLPFSNHGHAAVIIFFVLSGYVISYITATKESTPIEYWSSRLSRFYSLAIPVVLLSPLLDLVGEAITPAFYVETTTHTLAGLRILTSLTFLNEIWGISIMSFSNTPYWSLCYEMWYYALFAVFSFTSGRMRVILFTLIVLLLGPKILLLGPIWILGVVIQRWHALYKIPQWCGWLLFVSSLLAYMLFQHFELTEYGSELLKNMIGAERHRNLTFSKFFIMDYPLAIIIAANFVGFRRIAHVFGPVLYPVEKPIRWLSGYTFSLYIFHQPLLQFFAAMFHGDPGNSLFYAEVLGATLVTIVAIGSLTEQKRHHVKRWIRMGLTRVVQTDTWKSFVTPRMGWSGSGNLR